MNNTKKKNKYGIKSFDDLIKIIEAKKVIIGSGGVEHTAKELIKDINLIKDSLSQIQDVMLDIDADSIKKIIEKNQTLSNLIRAIPRTLGMREAVFKLTVNEVIRREKEKENKG